MPGDRDDLDFDRQDGMQGGIPAPEASVAEHAQPRNITNFRRILLFIVFCLAMFLDSFNLSALFAATSVLTKQFDLTEGESSWVISAFQLTYASFLLVVSLHFGYLHVTQR